MIVHSTKLYNKPYRQFYEKYTNLMCFTVCISAQVINNGNEELGLWTRDHMVPMKLLEHLLTTFIICPHSWLVALSNYPYKYTTLLTTTWTLKWHIRHSISFALWFIYHLLRPIEDAKFWSFCGMPLFGNMALIICRGWKHDFLFCQTTFTNWPTPLPPRFCFLSI